MQNPSPISLLRNEKKIFPLVYSAYTGHGKPSNTYIPSTGNSSANYYIIIDLEFHTQKEIWKPVLLGLASLDIHNSNHQWSLITIRPMSKLSISRYGGFHIDSCNSMATVDMGSNRVPNHIVCKCDGHPFNDYIRNISVNTCIYIHTVNWSVLWW